MGKKHFIDEEDDEQENAGCLPASRSYRDNLPVRRKLKVEPPEIKKINQNSTLEDVIEADLEISHNVLECLNKTWKWVGTINEAINLSKATMDVIGKRRVLANKKLGADKEIGNGDGALDITD